MLKGLNCTLINLLFRRMVVLQDLKDVPNVFLRSESFQNNLFILLNRAISTVCCGRILHQFCTRFERFRGIRSNGSSTMFFVFKDQFQIKHNCKSLDIFSIKFCTSQKFLDKSILRFIRNVVARAICRLNLN